MSGTGGLTKTGNGTLTLTASNGFSGGTTISGGVLAINSDAALAKLRAGQLQWKWHAPGGRRGSESGCRAGHSHRRRRPATFDTNGNAINVAGVIGGNGGLQKVGSGKLTLTGLNTYSGNTTVDGGTLQVPRGRLSSPTQYVGFSAAGSFLQSGGTNTIASGLYVGDGLGSSGSYGLSGSGLLSAANEYAGLGGSGVFTQSGGTNTVWNRLQVGTAAGTGVYALSGSGLLSASAVDIDFGGSFTQSGGTVSGSISLAVSPSSSGTYNLGGNGVIAASTLSIGQAGAAAFAQSAEPAPPTFCISARVGTAAAAIASAAARSPRPASSWASSAWGHLLQTGGTNAAASLYLGGLAGTSSYALSGSGLLSSPSQYLGYGGSGSFTQSGGTNQAAGTLYLGYRSGDQGAYGLSGSGLLSAPKEYIGYSGSSTFTQSSGTNAASGASNLYLGYKAGAADPTRSAAADCWPLPP